MAYLVTSDYSSVIQPVYLNQLTQNLLSNRLQAENTALSEMISYLAVKYDTDSEFASTFIYSNTQAYKANELIQFSYAAWVNATTYAQNSFISYNGSVYYSLINSNTGHQPDTSPTDWQLVGNLNDFYYLAYPYPEFQQQNFYNVGDKVFWNGSNYIALTQSLSVDHFANLQGQNVSESTPNVINAVPGDGSANSIAQWGTGTPYSVTGVIPNGIQPSAYNPSSTYTIGQTVLNAGIIWQALKTTTGNTPGADITNWQPITWTFGDNRNQQLVRYLCYMVIWYLSDTLAPRNKPEYWHSNYRMAIDWLVMVAREDNIKPNIPEKTPPQGKRIRWGSQTKQTNQYT